MKVMVVDDDPTLRWLMCELVRSDLHFETLEAADGQEAWETMASGVVPDLCIVDLRMPRMGGLELVAKCRAEHGLRKQKMMLCSTINDRATIVHAAALGINAYLLKPFRADKFVSLGAQALVGAVLQLGRVLSADNALAILPAIDSLQAENERVIAAAAEIAQLRGPSGISPQADRSGMPTHRSEA